MVAQVKGVVVNVRGATTKKGTVFTEIELLQAGNGNGKQSEIVRIRTEDAKAAMKLEVGKPSTLDVVIAEREWQGRRFVTCDLVV